MYYLGCHVIICFAVEGDRIRNQINAVPMACIAVRNSSVVTHVLLVYDDRFDSR